MTEKEDIRRFSLKELEERDKAGLTETRSDAPVYPIDDDFWENAKVVIPRGKTSVHLRVDTDVLDWFRAEGRGHLTRMNAVLKSYVEAHKRHDPR